VGTASPAAVRAGVVVVDEVWRSAAVCPRVERRDEDDDSGAPLVDDYFHRPPSLSFGEAFGGRELCWALAGCCSVMGRVMDGTRPCCCRAVLDGLRAGVG
jgi:hypothetical protein